MNGRFTKGMIIGGMVGASIGMMMGPDMMKNRTRRKVKRAGRQLLRRSGNWLEDIVDFIR